MDSPEQLVGLERVGRVVAETIATVSDAAAPDVTTGHLDSVAQAVFDRRGARSGPVLTYRYPAAICLSMDAEIVHGVPGEKRLREGQLLTIDVAAELDGYHADAATTIAIGQVRGTARRLMAAGSAALGAGVRAAQPGATLRDVGAAVERVTNGRGFRVARQLTGHGVGRAMHEPPTVFNWPDPSRDADLELTEGLVFTIEPMITTGRPRLGTGSDGWTVTDHDGALSTHEEHTVMVCHDGPLVLTAPG
ncbi:MAG: type I methionyl aminopeptidase [Solirubrobacteraceae bacterium MAG38_C4-C5]|nr:type I methionyl aminopeptidase [Candidatus Siliceabacter maunaloa]